MAIRTVVTRGLGNGTFSGSIALVVSRGFIGDLLGRSMTAAMVAEVTSASLQPILLVKLGFDAGDLNLWTGIGDLLFSGDTYTGAGDLLAFSVIEESDELRAVGLTGALSGMPSSLIAIALAEDYMGRPVTVWFGVLDSTGALVSSPVKVFAGLIDTMPIEDAGETATIQVQAENRLVRLEESRSRRYTPEDQAIDFAGDLGLDFVVALNDGREIVWGRSG